MGICKSFVSENVKNDSQSRWVFERFFSSNKALFEKNKTRQKGWVCFTKIISKKSLQISVNHQSPFTKVFLAPSHLSKSVSSNELSQKRAMILWSVQRPSLSDLQSLVGKIYFSEMVLPVASRFPRKSFQLSTIVKFRCEKTPKSKEKPDEIWRTQSKQLPVPRRDTEMKRAEQHCFVVVRIGTVPSGEDFTPWTMKRLCGITDRKSGGSLCSAGISKLCAICLRCLFKVMATFNNGVTNMKVLCPHSCLWDCFMTRTSCLLPLWIEKRV